ncbi:MAG: hypothetical protein LKJ91_02460, partial [Acidaminococcus sp.]|nr:hypothetical protein [Acidaminococcus sp.]MCI2114083.1 hypothetical protein [Acidaminococcus sp.]MCI2116024.1 hypothetical protein [Acidaminococcus sp.]
KLLAEIATVHRKAVLLPPTPHSGVKEGLRWCYISVWFEFNRRFIDPILVILLNTHRKRSP